MIRIDKVFALDRGLALELSRRRDFPDVRNFYLPRSSRATVGRMNPQLKRGIMQGHTCVCSRRTW
jgi:hypothetical protein